MSSIRNLRPRIGVSLPSRGAWIEIAVHRTWPRTAESLPSRGAWIEIMKTLKTYRLENVAPLTGSVD